MFFKLCRMITLTAFFVLCVGGCDQLPLPGNAEKASQAALTQKKEQLFQRLNAINDESRRVTSKWSPDVLRRATTEERAEAVRQVDEVARKRAEVTTELNQVLSQLGQDPI